MATCLRHVPRSRKLTRLTALQDLSLIFFSITLLDRLQHLFESWMAVRPQSSRRVHVSHHRLPDTFYGSRLPRGGNSTPCRSHGAVAGRHFATVIGELFWKPTSCWPMPCKAPGEPCSCWSNPAFKRSCLMTEDTKSVSPKVVFKRLIWVFASQCSSFPRWGRLGWGPARIGWRPDLQPLQQCADTFWAW